DVVEVELKRMHGRLPELDGRARAEVAATVRRVVDKLLHAPTVRVKELANGPDGATYESALVELFALDRRAVAAVTQPTPIESPGGAPCPRSGSAPGAAISRQPSRGPSLRRSPPLRGVRSSWSRSPLAAMCPPNRWPRS